VPGILHTRLPGDDDDDLTDLDDIAMWIRLYGALAHDAEEMSDQPYLRRLAQYWRRRRDFWIRRQFQIAPKQDSRWSDCES
jgi:hypothetical protein